MAEKDDDTGAPQGLDAVRAAMQRKPDEPKPADPPPADADDADDEGEDGSDPKDAENAKLRAALKKANKDAERNRRRAKAAGADDEGEDAEKPKEEDRTAKLERELWTRDAIEELREAGCQGDKRRLRRVVRMLDSVHPDEVEDAIDDLKEDYPDLFKEEEEEEKPKPRRRRAPKAGPGGAERGRGSSRRGNLSSTSEALLRQAGY